MTKLTINDIALTIGSGITPLRSNDSFWDNPRVPWLKTEQLGEFQIFDTSEYISPTALEQTNIKLWPQNTISIAMYGEGKTRGNASIIMREMATNQACCNVIVNPELADFRFLYYWVKSNYEQLRVLSSGVRKNLNSDDIKRFPFPDVKLHIQKKIADVLYAIDLKILNNSCIIAELKAMAKTIYYYWFVQFDFPNEIGKPYKSSGGAMVYNEQLKNEIPVGWAVRNIEEIAAIKAGGDRPSVFSMVETNECTVPIYANGIENKGLYGYTDRSVVNLPSVTVSARGTIGYSVLRTTPFVPIIRLISITPNEQYYAKYLELFLNEYRFQKNGSIQQQLTVPDVAEMKIVCPTPNVMEQFVSLTNPIIVKESQVEKENQELTNLRDWLLPMLMNGQVTVE